MQIGFPAPVRTNGCHSHNALIKGSILQRALDHWHRHLLQSFRDYGMGSVEWVVKNIQRKPFTLEGPHAICLWPCWYCSGWDHQNQSPQGGGCKWLLGVELFSKTCSSPNLCLVPVNVTLFGDWYFEDVSKLKWGHTRLGWAPNPTTRVLSGRGKFQHVYREENDVWWWRRRWEWLVRKARNTKDFWQHQKLRRRKGGFSPTGSVGASLCQPLGFGLLVSKPGRE